MKKHNRKTVADIRALKGKRMLSMLYVETLDEARAAAAVGIDMLSIVEAVWTPEMREAAGDCFVQVGLLPEDHATAADYVRAALKGKKIGGDSFYCAASFDIVRTMAAEGLPVVGHVGLVPSRVTWTGGFKAVGKDAESAYRVYELTKKYEEAGAFAAELEVVPDRVAAEITKRTSLIMLGMGAGPGADAQYLFTEDVLGHTRYHRPRHAKVYRDFAAEYERLQKERIAAFQEFSDDVASGEYPQPHHVVPIKDEEFNAFMKKLDG
jgi:3-methyl-2-oxobutanoate hydroxymethyltransferase